MWHIRSRRTRSTASSSMSRWFGPCSHAIGVVRLLFLYEPWHPGLSSDDLVDLDGRFSYDGHVARPLPRWIHIEVPYLLIHMKSNVMVELAKLHSLGSRGFWRVWPGVLILLKWLDACSMKDYHPIRLIHIFTMAKPWLEHCHRDWVLGWGEPICAYKNIASMVTLCWSSTCHAILTCSRNLMSFLRWR
jgi:hypothetical protein